MDVSFVGVEVVGLSDSGGDAGEVGFGEFAFGFVEGFLFDLFELLFGEGLFAEDGGLLFDDFILGVGVEGDDEGGIFAVGFDLIFKLAFNRRQRSVTKTYIPPYVPLSKRRAFSWFANCVFDRFGTFS